MGQGCSEVVQGEAPENQAITTGSKPSLPALGASGSSSSGAGEQRGGNAKHGKDGHRSKKEAAARSKTSPSSSPAKSHAKVAGSGESLDIQHLRTELEAEERSLESLRRNANHNMCLVESLEREAFKKDEALKRLKAAVSSQKVVSDLTAALHARDTDINELRKKMAMNEESLRALGPRQGSVNTQADKLSENERRVAKEDLGGDLKRLSRAVVRTALGGAAVEAVVAPTNGASQKVTSAVVRAALGAAYLSSHVESPQECVQNLNVAAERSIIGEPRSIVADAHVLTAAVSAAVADAEVVNATAADDHRAARALVTHALLEPTADDVRASKALVAHTMLTAGTSQGRSQNVSEAAGRSIIGEPRSIRGDTQNLNAAVVRAALGVVAAEVADMPTAEDHRAARDLVAHALSKPSAEDLRASKALVTHAMIISAQSISVG